MLPAGKLPLHFLFLTGFVVGLFAVYFGRGILLNRAGMLDEDTLYRMKYMTVDSSILFWYVLCKRCRNFLVLIIMATTYLGWIFCGGVTVKYGFSVGFFLSTAVFRYGIKGILLGIVSIFPHYLCYLPAMILLLRWCEDMHRSIYFYHHTTGQGKKSLARQIGKTGAHMDRTGFRMFIGMFCESCVIKRIPAVFFETVLTIQHPICKIVLFIRTQRYRRSDAHCLPSPDRDR